MSNKRGIGLTVLVCIITSVLTSLLTIVVMKNNIGDTNQMMELIAALEACKWATNQYHDDITIYSDSAYLVNCYNDKWFIKWENNIF